ncbi:hypothetical protein RRG08_019962 [Elysia crispata]|uniref:Heme NO-binding domain-containing protein n=1 Tax=Elysia crispata TaxID=231223 RepID=A0AAE0YJM2_9GAST|nr:hypothetical protein RRG08_019962 [Elysia crispata]
MEYQNYERKSSSGDLGSLSDPNSQVAVVVVNLSREHILEVFGDYFLVYCLRHGYDDMLRTLGNDMAGFLQSLDSLHSLLALTYDNMSAPSFSMLSKAMVAFTTQPTFPGHRGDSLWYILQTIYEIATRVFRDSRDDLLLEIRLVSEPGYESIRLLKSGKPSSPTITWGDVEPSANNGLSIGIPRVLFSISLILKMPESLFYLYEPMSTNLI